MPKGIGTYGKKRGRPKKTGKEKLKMQKVKGKKNFLQKFFSSVGEQEQTIAKKNVIIDALHGEFYKKQPALESIKEFIGVHKDWIERIKQNHNNDEKVGNIKRDLAYEYQMNRVNNVKK